jgi:uncharacterized RDD family membrane protein YckC
MGHEVDRKMDEASQLQTAGVQSGAGFGIRAGARIIDTVYGLALGFIGGIFAGIGLIILEQAGIVAPGWQERMGGLNLPGWILGLFGTLVYHSLTEGMYGASLGKLICQLRVVTEDARAITVTRALKRSLAYFWDSLFFGLVGYTAMKTSELNQRYGDRWAKTVVVRSRDMPADSKSGVEIFVLAFLMGSVFWTILLALGLVLHVR